ncbi:hypothetical protein C5B85_12200 [Pseudoclavibacter sp. AY1F1]|uniref:DUF3060 domain-containing protein n=1 Tax=Pseudoclavibacter sp. AY1F1 TaxID=2080583 RepID=UPI000CE72C0D|nr:DUF3060 domain-containing protein [Pseudoclavibacter sp. AY1F1]PPF43901.1 hypothetical protein C5B85_12200 [Pseudoclavibacter sp. AY1F1]
MNIQTRSLTAIALAGIAVSGAFGLAGCTARVVEEPTATAPAAPSESVPPASTARVTTETSAPVATAQQTAPQSTQGADGAQAGASEERAELTAGATVMLTCGGGTLDIDDTYIAQVVEVTDDCETLSITTATAVVVAQNVGTLSVDGVSNAVLVASAETITLDGSTNSVMWETGSPTVANSGTSNSAYKAS